MTDRARRDVAVEVPPMSLREEKKELTRRALVDEAIDRFLTKGYEATTLEEIAAAVRVSMRTLLRYFESKEKLFHAWHYRALDRFEQDLAGRGADQSVLAFWRTWVQKYAARANASADLVKHRIMHETHPSLHAHWLMILRRYEDFLTAALVDEVGPEHRLEARLAAVTLVGGNEAAARAWIGAGATGDLVAACVEVVDIAERLFAPVGISARAPKLRTRNRRGG